MSCWHSNKELAEHLLALKADVNSRNGNGGTALHAAAWYSDVDLVKILLNAGADYSSLDNLFRTPLDCVGKGSKDGKNDAIVCSLIDAKVEEDEISWLELQQEKSKRNAILDFHRERMNSDCPSTSAEVLDVLNWPHVQIKGICKLEFDEMLTPAYSSEHVVFPTVLTYLSSDGIERKYATVVKFCLRSNNQGYQGAALYRSPSGSEITLMSMAHLQQTLINYKLLDEYIKGGKFKGIGVVPVCILRVASEWFRNIESVSMELDPRLALDPLIWVEERLDRFQKFVLFKDNPGRKEKVSCLTSASDPELFQLQKYIYENERNRDNVERTVCDLQGAVVKHLEESSSFCSFHSFEDRSSLIVLCDVEFTDTLEEKLELQPGELLTGFVNHLLNYNRENLVSSS